ncbi:MAG: FAD-dependent monooxygenase [Pleurocapsa sp. MO_192.B19]|nr:FAD-dependent monooxygenase [Pleurocapsa sp. MO_192.B19]
MAQVVIVGAGPTGATMALLLIKRGIHVKLVEASRDFKRLFRGEGLMPSGLNALKQMGLLELLADVPHQSFDAWEFLLSGKLLFKVKEPIEPNGRPCTTVSQPHLLEAIIKQAETYSEFEFIPGEPVRDILRSEERVSGVKLGSGREITADLVIAADGRNSMIRKQAGLNLTQLQNNIDILWFKLDSSSWPKSENIFYSILQERDGFGLFRASEGQLHIGWGLHSDDNFDWRHIDWAEKLAATSPSWLAEYFRSHRETITQPLLLSVIVGRCDRWSIPGLLLLGDAVHPMSPIRAQGINMAFRDVIVAANYLVPWLNKSEIDLSQIDAVLPQIQQEREPEIIRIQQLQAQEIAQAEKLRNSTFLRWGAKTFTLIIRPGIRASWLRRQKQLRQGVTQVSLNI